MTRPLSSAPTIPDFEYVGLLGSGGFSDVFRYADVGLGRSVAVKVLLADVDQAAFESEAKVMARLGNHPSIVSIFQVGRTADGRAFLVMEYCPPPHLGLRLRGRDGRGEPVLRPLSVAKALEVSIQLAGAVETAHRQGILHRDIKPANILFTEFDRPALTDFGIAEATGRAEAGQGIGMSPPWAPPEQLRAGSPMGVTGDVYSLAATLWTSLVGRSPFSVPGGANDTVSLAQRVRTQPVPRTGRADVTDTLENIFRVAMAKQPGDRFASAQEFARALQAVQAEMHMGVTAIEVRSQPIELAVEVDQREAGGTHITGFVAIDPDGGPIATADSPTSAPTQTGPGLSGRTGYTTPDPSGITGPGSGTATGFADADTAMDATGRAPARGDRFTSPPERADDRPVPPAPPAADRASDRAERPRRGLAAIAASAVLVAGIGGVLATQLGGHDAEGTSNEGPVPESNDQADPLTSAVPAPVQVSVVRRSGRTLQVTWTNPAPESGDAYLFKLDDPEESLPWEQTSSTTATVTGKPGRMCVIVAILRADHQTSNQPAHACPSGGGAK